MSEVLQLFPTPVYNNNLGLPEDLSHVNYRITHLDNAWIADDE